MRVLLFTGKNCPACGVMKKNLKKHNIYYEEIDVESQAGRKLSAMCHIKGIPMMFLFDGDIPIKGFTPGVIPERDLEKIKEKYL
jgi:glutaredoxin